MTNVYLPVGFVKELRKTKQISLYNYLLWRFIRRLYLTLQLRLK